MALKITPKPYEKFIIGGAVISNGDSKRVFLVENDVPILRGKDILSLAEDNTPCKKIYFAIQLMYIDGKNMPEHHKTFWELVKDVAVAAPSRKPLLKEISENILDDKYYQALKLTKTLIEYEREVIPFRFQKMTDNTWWRFAGSGDPAYKKHYCRPHDLTRRVCWQFVSAHLP